MATSPNIRRGWAKLRVSRAKQANVQHGSLEQQRHRTERWEQQTSKETGAEYKIIRVIEEDCSGRKEKFHLHFGFEEILFAIRNKKIDFVVVESVSRLGRWQRKNLELVEAAHEKGVEVFFIDGGKYDHTNKGDRIKFGINNLMAEEESNDNKERVEKKQREARVNNGKDSSACPILGIDAHPTKAGFYVVNEQEREIVTDIFKNFIRLKELTALEAYCKEGSRNYKTKARVTRERVDKLGNRVLPKNLGGEPFDTTTLRTLLTSPKLRGENFFIDTWNQFPHLRDGNGIVKWEYAHGRVIPKDLTYQVDVILGEKKIHGRRSTEDGQCYYLKGVLQSPDGTAFYGRPGGGHKYYALARGTFKDQIKPIPKQDIEGLVAKRVRQYLSESATIHNVIQASFKNRLTGIPLLEEQIQDKERLIRQLQSTIDGFTAALRLAVQENPSNALQAFKGLQDEKDKATAEYETTKMDLQILRNKKMKISDRLENQTFAETMKRVLRGFDNAKEIEKAALVSQIFSKIVVYPDYKIDLLINADPNGARPTSFDSTPCHGSGQKIRIHSKWRE